MELPDHVEADHHDGNRLIALTTNDVVTDDIATDLLSASERGKQLVQNFVKQRIIKRTEPIYSTIKRQNSKTFKHLYSTAPTSVVAEKRVIKDDRKLIPRLLNASQTGRKVDMSSILKHELTQVRLSLAKMNGTMNSIYSLERLIAITQIL